MVSSFREAVRKPITSARHNAILDRIVAPLLRRGGGGGRDDDDDDDNDDDDTDDDDEDGRRAKNRSSKPTSLAGRVWQADHITEVLLVVG